MKKIYRYRKEHIEWISKVLERDNNTCQWCHVKENLVAHHIIPWKERPDLSLDLNNGLTLCRACHMRHHKNKKGHNQIPWNKGIKTGVGGPKGRKFTEEHRLKLRIKKLDFIFTDEHRKKLRESKTPENIEKNKLRYKGRSWTIDPETGKRKWI